MDFPYTPSAYFELTNQCNYRCKYCYNDSMISKTNRISTEGYKEFVGFLKKYGLEYVALSGGEPFLHPDVEEILMFNHALGLRQTMITNGSLLNEARYKLIKEYNIKCFLTIDGFDEATHDRYRGKGTYSILMENLNEFARRNLIENISVRINLTRSNAYQVADTFRMIYDMGIRDFAFGIISPAGRGKDTDYIDYYKDPAFLNEINERIKALENELSLPRLEVPTGITIACPLTQMGKRFKPRIDYNGDIFPCQRMTDQDYLIGNIFHIESIQMGFEKILEKIRRRDHMKDKCKKCAYCGICMGGCLVEMLQNKDNPDYQNFMCDSIKGLCHAKIAAR